MTGPDKPASAVGGSNGLYKALTGRSRTARSTGPVHIEDRGDGALILVPADVPKIALVTTALAELEAAVTATTRGARRRSGCGCGSR